MPTMPTKKLQAHNPLASTTNMDSSLPRDKESSNVDEMSQYNEDQRDEYLALEAIYQDAFQKIDGKAAAWQKHRNLAYSLNLAVPTDPEVFVRLEIELPRDYPKVAPIIKLADLQTPISAVSAQIHKTVKSYPKANAGRVFIFDLCDAILQILQDDASVRAGRKPVPALNEERMTQQATTLREEEKRMQQLQKHEPEQNDTAEESIRMQAKMSQASKVMAIRTRAGRSVDESQHIDHTPGIMTFTQNMVAYDVVTEEEFTFKQVSGRTRLLERRDKTVTIVTPIAPAEISVPEFVLKEIRLSEGLGETDLLRNAMGEVEDLLEKIKALHHTNIVDIIGYNIRQTTTPDSSSESKCAFWELAILSEFSRKGSLRDYLWIAGALTSDLVRSWGHQLLEGLEFLENHNYIHPAIHEGNIIIFLAPRGDITIKLSDGYGTTLRTLTNKAKPGSSAGTETPFWEAPELTRANENRTTKTCIWELGVVMLKMASGFSITEAYTSPSNCIDSSSFVTSFNELLAKMLAADPARRLKAFDLQNFGFFRDKKKSLFNTKPSGIPTTPSRRGRQSSSQILNPMPRYEREWQDEVKIGFGGQAKVFKAKYINDGQFYAVKKVVCQSRQELDALVAEVKLLSRINHPLIVRYFNSWDEKEYSSAIEPEESSEDSSNAVQFDPSDDPFGVTGVPASGYDYSNIAENVGIQFGNDREEGEEPGIETAEREFRARRAAGEEADNEYSFGSDEDKDSREGSDVESSNRRRINPIVSREVEPEKITLYIQMELCENKTLRSRLTHLASDPQEGWRMFRQILEALKHIQEHGIVHRDLKPDNIFLDAGNNIRIGDFGLATTGQVAVSGSSGRDMRSIATRQTLSIGTPLYIAPELRTGGGGRYTFKVDMFSLGIIFFEMCFAMPTFMERSTTLRKLAESPTVLPAKFQDSEWSAQGNIILLLISRQQDERPSAAELLEGGLVPQPVKDQELQQYLNTMLDRDPAAYANIIAKYFSAPVPKAIDLRWASNTEDIPLPLKAGDVPLLADKALSVFVRSMLEGVFRRHGAVRTNRQGIFPKSEIYSGAATFLDTSGIAMQLPYDLTLPFARSIANRKPSYQKAYAIGSTFRASQSSDTLNPVRRTEASFDYVSENAIDISVKEAEAIKVLDECLSAFPEIQSKDIHIYLNHVDLLNAILGFCGIKPEQNAAVIRVLSLLNIREYRWKDIHAQLRSRSINIKETSLNSLARFDFRDSLTGTTARLKQVFEDGPRLDRVTQVMTRLGQITSNLEHFQLHSKVYISPLSNNSEPLYRGSLMIQCIDPLTRKLLAVGGRYDELVRSFQPATKVRAVGFRLDVPGVINLIKVDAEQKRDSRMLKGAWNETGISALPQRCDILITSFDSKLHSSVCLDIAQSLWNEGMNAEITDYFGNLDEFLAAYKEETHCWAVIVRPDRHSGDGHVIKLRHLMRKDETEIHSSDLVSALKNELGENPEKMSTRLRRYASGVEPPSAAPLDAPEVVVLSSQHKSKKVNRQTVIDASLSRRRELASSLVASAPIVAIETSDAVLQSIRATRISSPESWRGMIQTAPHQEARYLQELQEQLKEWAERGKAGAFIYNHRTRGCIFYDLGKAL